MATAMQASAQVPLKGAFPKNFVFVPRKISPDSMFYRISNQPNPMAKGRLQVDYYQNLPPAMAPNLSMQQWGWVCRTEYKFQQATKIPLYFRLGSKQYADRLEGK
jgi:hypothetical protein